MMRRISMIGLSHRLGLLAAVAASLLPVAAHAADGETRAESPTAKVMSATPTKTASAQAAGEVHAWPIHLQHIKPTDFLKMLLSADTSVRRTGQKPSMPPLLPPAVQSITPDDTSGTITVEGDEASVLQVREIARLLDVVPKEVKLVIRFTHAPNAKQPSSFVQPVLIVAVVQVKNNEPVDIAAFTENHLLQAHIILHINGDNSVSLGSTLTSQALGRGPVERGAEGLWVSPAPYVGPTWYHRTASLLPSDFLENGGSIADPAKVKTVSYTDNRDSNGNFSLPPKGEYAISVAPILAPTSK